MELLNLLKVRTVKVAAYLVASGFITELLDLIIRHLSEADLGETGSVVTMGAVNVVLLLLIRKRDALRTSEPKNEHGNP